jgi:hypothetical protein
LKTKFFGWLVFGVGLGAYIPLIIGGWQHPSETNIACFIIWIMLAGMFSYSAYVQKYDGWRINLAFLFGNITVVVIALMRGGYTFNLGPSEMISLYGIVGTLCLWVVIGVTTKKWSADVLYLGGIIADILSFYPILKQYLERHERATTLGVIAWSMFGIAAFLNFTCVEQLFRRLRLNRPAYAIMFQEEKSLIKIFKNSAFSLENFSLIVITTVLMSR